MKDILNGADIIIVKSPDGEMYFKPGNYQEAAEIGAKLALNDPNRLDEKEAALIKLYLEKQSWRLLIRLLEMFNIIRGGNFQ